MLINSIELKNFTVFENLSIDVSSDINIFIGENGTGKTHLLKAIYGSCEISNSVNHKNFVKNYDVKRLNDSFNVNPDKVNLVRDAQKGEAEVSLKIANDAGYAVGVYQSKYKVRFPQVDDLKPVFIPSKDMLTHSSGLLAMSDKYRDFPFDRTLTEIIRKANQWTLKQPPELARSILPTLEEMIDGKIVIKDEEFYIVKNDGHEINFAVEAEGFKKIGLLWQLLMNESITPHSILIWDEPEANLNPAFIPQLVECLLELSRNNVQIFLSTHNYILAKYFNVKATESDSIMFHGLYKSNDSVQCESNENFSALKHNSIVKVFNALLDEVYDLDLGD